MITTIGQRVTSHDGTWPNNVTDWSGIRGTVTGYLTPNDSPGHRIAAIKLDNQFQISLSERYLSPAYSTEVVTTRRDTRYTAMAGDVLTAYSNHEISAAQMSAALDDIRTVLDPEWTPGDERYGRAMSRARVEFIARTHRMGMRLEEIANQRRANSRNYPTTPPESFSEFRARMASWGEYQYEITCTGDGEGWHPTIPWDIPIYSLARSRCPVCRATYGIRPLETSRPMWACDAVRYTHTDDDFHGSVSTPIFYLPDIPTHSEAYRTAMAVINPGGLIPESEFDLNVTDVRS